MTKRDEVMTSAHHRNMRAATLIGHGRDQMQAEWVLQATATKPRVTP
jgi:hypothetical protein